LPLLDKHASDFQLISPRPFQMMHSEKPAWIVQWFREEVKNWIPFSAVMTQTKLAPNFIDYVPCYRSEAGTGNAMAFMYWQ
jgi:hypothetical protein